MCYNPHMKTVNIGKENSTFQQLLALKNNRNKRMQLNMFFVEGVQNIKEAIANRWEIYAFIYSSSTHLSEWAKSIIEIADVNYVLDEKLMQMLSDKTDTSEILAIIKMKKEEKLIIKNNPIYVLLDRPSKKGNLGTIIRSCDAFNVDHIFYSGHGVDIYDHEVITASMGSFFKIPITFIKSNNDFLELIKNIKSISELQIIATSLQAKQVLSSCDFHKPTLILIGNETYGLSKFYYEVADKTVIIKMREGIDSLNVACATSVCLYEIQRQRNDK